MSTIDLGQELYEALEEARDEKRRLSEALARLIPSTRVKLAAIVKKHGMVLCEECCGFGAIDCPNAGVFRKFGMQDWTGCRRCGGSENTAGRGWYSPPKGATP